MSSSTAVGIRPVVEGTRPSHGLITGKLLLLDSVAEQPRTITISFARRVRADRVRHGTSSDIVIPRHFVKRLALVAGAALAGRSNRLAGRHAPIFDREVPDDGPDVPANLLNPRRTWKDSDAYNRQARQRATMFTDNFRTFPSTVGADVTAAGPAV